MRKLLSKTLRSHLAYFAGCALLLSGGLILSLFLEKGELLLYFSYHRSPNLNMLFMYLTRLGEFYLFVLLAIIFLFYRYRHSFVLLLLGLATLICSGILKTIFKAPRPYEWMLEGGRLDAFQMVEGIYLSGGMTSFPSGHTLAAFSLFTYLACLRRNTIFQLFCLIVAASVGLSRIYLGMHFLEDVLFGGLIGLVLGLLIYLFQEFRLKGRGKWERNLFVREKVISEEV